jgi:putative sigma-54 modulation protein
MGSAETGALRMLRSRMEVFKRMLSLFRIPSDEKIFTLGGLARVSSSGSRRNVFFRRLDTLSHGPASLIMMVICKGATMNLNITFRHMDHTPALDQMIREKSEKFTKWFGPDASVKWTCWREGVEHTSEVFVTAGQEEYFAKAHADDLYKTFDLIINKIQNQLK